MHDELRRLDLNLLPVFDAMYRHRSVVAAADELNISPSACSHALARLRTALADELFVRFGQGMQPTGRAEQLSTVVAAALASLSSHLAQSRPFDPSSSEQAFVFAATDYTAFVLVPRLVAHLQCVAPKLRIKVVHSSRQDTRAELATGNIDFALGFADEFDEKFDAKDGIDTADGFTDDYVVLARKGHPKVQHQLSLDSYLAERHVAVTPWGEARGVIDLALERLGLRRQVAVQLPSLLAAPSIIATSNLLLTLPRYAARLLNSSASFSLFPPPFAAPTYTLKVYSHARNASTQGHRWVREQVLNIATKLTSTEYR